ncbi:MAG: CDP-archaeol synthase [Woeseiaceae bacterium]|nr:CDP-archaeol synthase [Woeseiaceae bacterium]
MDFAAAARALLLIAAASSAPWAVGRVFGNRWAWPLDFGYVLPDGKRLFGAHKTWRGLAAGIGACALIGWVLGPGWLVGCGVAALALVGDALSSSIKRRMNRAPGSEVPGLDQVPESLLPLLVLHGPLGISLGEALLLTLVFAGLDLLFTPLRHGR